MKKIKISFKKIYLFAIILSLIITITTSIYLKLTTTEGIILNDNLVVKFREEVYISQFIKSLDGTLVSNYKVNTNEVGYKDVIITFKNNFGFIVSKNITIQIVDITPPTIVVSNLYTVVKNTISNLEEEIFCADDYDDNISCTIKGDYNLNIVGNYNLEIIATDKSGNTTTKTFTLNVIEKQKSNNQNSQKDSTNFKNIYNKYKDNNTLIGLDISKWQGNVNYKKLKEQGVDFVMLKIGGQNSIDGEYNIDPMFYDNIKGATENNINVGVYFYSYANDINEAQEQADWVVAKLDDYKINMPIVFDWENWNKYTKFHISFHTLNKIASSFIKRVEELGYDGILYSSKYYLENIWYQNEYDNWLAYYNKDFNNYKNYYMWQLCDNGKIDGIDSYVDINIMYKEL